MNAIAAPVNDNRRSRTSEPMDRAAIVKDMSEHLVSAIRNGLNTANDTDVIGYLWNLPNRYPSRVVLDHMDDALAAAKRLCDEMSDPQYERQQNAVAVAMSDDRR